jgi:hypothetical protein
MTHSLDWLTVVFFLAMGTYAILRGSVAAPTA